ncbi:hypothetical protein PRIPAC_92289 [Pristionchus pacificus]|uniref:Uncharacterized protein n=1 Tax=Pristionchus pacificus TaxID=54126 RepID=A0A2A6BQC3_PRIPA|nr:hypothetical protein PRIPAC_92289 [Pristionchus pacificus]|eukprot:PDM67971.1 hypothetical protein PRIPAC_46015 [Pristionchus pacificus]
MFYRSATSIIPLSAIDMHFRHHVSTHFTLPHVVMPYPHQFPTYINACLPAHNAVPHCYASPPSSPIIWIQPIVRLPMPLQLIQPSVQYNQFPSTSDSRAVNINGLMVYSVAVPIAPRRNDLCTLDHDHNSGCLMKSQDVRKQGALVRTAQEVLKKKDVVQTVPNNNEETPMAPSHPMELAERPPTVAEKVEKAFPFLADAKAVEAIRKKHPERYNVGVIATRLIRKFNLIEQKYKICTQSLPSLMLKMKFANKAIRYNRHAENIRTKHLNNEKETQV